ncbi:putative acetyltransferase [Nitrospirillum iridis]|uniref:Putative acetyltransferase n=1 Tax=Nitrospirillum iridis TaxID=765888 RepID=A0A7X0EB80_9PROT|nr:GNAT family N-acetyltransferase [Nitrospirillum iridis]MBB6250288.1 putative acetyltransferase [Nitrospirillum iridis]
MLVRGEAYSASLYLAESNHHLSIEDFRAANVRFLVGRDAEGRAVATGAVVLNGRWAELKAMWVVPAARGRGASKTLLAALEAQARGAGVETLRLETGVSNHEALGLYARAGFVRCGPFADYRLDPLSVFMGKAFTPMPLSHHLSE